MSRLFIILSGLLLLVAQTLCADVGRRPNVVIVLVDDMGYSDLGCFGSEIGTPHIDRLAANGIRYSKFYNTAKCYPTRASLLTGLYHQRALDGKVLNDQCVTLAEVLGKNGYETGMSGKWHLNGQNDLDNQALQPLARGFDRFFGTILGAGSYFDPYTLQRGNERIEPKKGFYYTDAITEDAVERINDYARRDVPFFQYVAYTAPHWPLQIPDGDPAVARYEKVYSKGWDAIREQRFKRQTELGLADAFSKLSPRHEDVPAWEAAEDRAWEIRRMAVYAAMLERVDDGVGEIVEALRRQELLENTLILFLSDNGGAREDISPKNGLHQLGGNPYTRDGRKIQISRDPSFMPGPETTFQGYGPGWANVSNTPFRLFKVWAHEGGIATPLIAHWPEGIRNPGRISAQVGHVIDLMPTIADATGSRYPKTCEGQTIHPVDGVSLLGSFHDEPSTKRTLYWDFADHAAIRSGDWKLVATSTRARNWELYDLSRDGSELENLAAGRVDKVRELSSRWEAWAREFSSAETSAKPKSSKTKGKKKKAEKASSPTATKTPPIYSNDSYALMRDSIVEGERQAVAKVKAGNRYYLINANAEMVRPQLKGDYPKVKTESMMFDQLYRIALADMEMNIVEDEKGTYFRVSPDFPNMIFTRDTAYSSYLGASHIMPDVVKSHLRIARGLRRDLGFKCPADETIPFPGVDNQPEDLNNFEFYLKYGTNAYARRTDDPCWVIGYWEALCVEGGTDELKWLINEYEYFDGAFYDHFYDDSDGLYYGQASFIDVSGTGYPEEYDIQDSLRVKALSTNCLYVGAMDRIARACEIVGRKRKAKAFRQRADELREAIRREFKHPEGYYSYFKDPQGRLQPRREQLGMAFAVLFDVLPPSEFSAAVDGYPVGDFGSPTLYPFFPGEKVYHNRAIWPFADTFYHRALLKTHRTDEVLLRTLGNLSRNALLGNFTEIMDYETGGWQVKHARSYIWSASAYLSVVFKMIAGIDVEKLDRVEFHPHLPKSLGSSISIEGIQACGMILDIRIKGNGNRIASFKVDGEERSGAYLMADGQNHVVEIELSPKP